jgi:type IV pilus assembly protein PilV
MLYSDTPIFPLSNKRQLHMANPSILQRGFSLVEVLVSIFILTVGLLGMVGMQAASLQSNREAKLQSSAVVLARELADMVRGNKSEGIKTTSNPYIGTYSSPLTFATPTYCLNVATPSTCGTTTAVANAEMTEWLTRVDNELPSARVAVCFDSTPFDAGGLPQWTCTNTGSVMVIKIGWTRGSTNRGQAGSAGLDRATVPSVVIPVTAGSAT